MKHSLKRTLAALLLLASMPLAAAAQTLSFNGVVEKITTVTICPGFQHRVQGTDTLLTSSVLDLDGLVGKTVQLTGVDASGSVCTVPIFDVTAVGPATATLEACGTARPGCPITFRVGPPTISVGTLYYSLGGAGFLPVGDPLGVIFMDPPWIVAGQSFNGQDIELAIPPAAPVGLTIRMQAHHLDVGPVMPPGALTNPLTFTLLPQGPLCVDPSSCW